jgi:hypothetical protein
MGTPLIGLTLKDACDLVQAYADRNADGDILAGAKMMLADEDDLDREDLAAIRMFMRAGQEMFKPRVGA